MKWLAMVRAEPRTSRVWNLWLRDVRTGALTRLTNYSFGQTWNASWFPDSKLICYSHEDRLVVLDITTRAARIFESPQRGHLVRTPAVSPDGTRIIFQVHKDGVWLLDLTDGSLRRVLDDASAEEFSWDPRGSRVAYHSHRDGTWRIWLMTAPSA
jgi:Tol biopolymer transport system component